MMDALQCILNVVSQTPELRGGPGEKVPGKRLQRRIQLAASLSDALFGLARAPGCIQQRLASVCEDVITLLGEPDAATELHVSAEIGFYPATLEETVLRVAHELVGNAVRHGMRARRAGSIEVALRTGYGRTILTVSDDGWGYGGTPMPGDGLSLAALLAAQNGGSVRLQRQSDRTVARLELPCGARPESCQLG